MRAYFGLFRRELLLSCRQGGEIGLALGFFVLAVVLFPLGVGPEAEMLRRIGAGIIWVAALLAALLMLSAMPLEGAVVVKCAAHWITTGLPLVVLSPFLALLLDMEMPAIPV